MKCFHPLRFCTLLHRKIWPLSGVHTPYILLQMSIGYFRLKILMKIYISLKFYLLIYWRYLDIRTILNIFCAIFRCLFNADELTHFKIELQSLILSTWISSFYAKWKSYILIVGVFNFKEWNVRNFIVCRSSLKICECQFLKVINIPISYLYNETQFLFIESIIQSFVLSKCEQGNDGINISF